MFENANYQHPELEPYSSGSWKEVVLSWVLAGVVVAALLFSV